MPPFPSLTKQWHSKAYSAIDPTRPELTAKGKVIAITGGGGSIGCATALAFAKAGAEKIALIGRRDGPLEETKKAVESEVNNVQILTLQGDLSKATSMKDALATVGKEFGKINILVANAGYLSKFETLESSDPDEWWTGFEINTKGAFNTVRAFLPVAAPYPIIIDISTCVVHMPAMASASGYVSSKLAGTKIFETAAAENKDLSVIHVHPGVIYSELNIKSGISASDDADLPGSFIVWAVSPEAEFLRGKYLWVNWDVDELKSRKDELSRPDQLSITMNGWPFGQDASTEALKF